MGQGQNVGGARATLTVDAQFEQARAASRQFAQEIERIFGGVQAQTVKTERSLGNLSNSFSQMASAFGVSLGVAGVAQLARMALESDKLATAFARQQVAAENLAGSQGQLTELLSAYNRATGGTIGRAQALSDVVRLQAVGFGDSAEELERFARVARGISVAMGQTQDYVIGQLQLAIANQSTLRLDQLGLGVSEVKDRIDQLRAADSSLTKEMAYQNAIMEIAERKFGALADSTEAQATGAEKAAKAWQDFRLEMGQTFGPTIDTAMESMTRDLAGISGMLQDLAGDARQLRQALSEAFDIEVPSWLGSLMSMDLRGASKNALIDVFAGNRWEETQWNSRRVNSEGSIGGVNVGSMGQRAVQRQASRAPSGPIIDEQAEARNEATLDWYRENTRITIDANNQILAENRSYHQQRAEAERNYSKTVAREAEDFAINRQRQEQQLAESIAEVRENGAERERQAMQNLADDIADLREDAARQEARWARDLERSLSEARRESAERIANAEEDHQERLAEAREDSAERLAERQNDLEERLLEARGESLRRLADIERGYQRDREQAAAQHQDSVIDAASRLDAKALDQEQRRFARESQEREQAYTEAIAEEKQRLADIEAEHVTAHQRAIAEEQKRLQQFIDEANKAHAERIRDEKTQLAERVRQENEAHQQRVSDAKEALDQRLIDLNQAREDQKIANDTADNQRVEDLITHHGKMKTQEDADRLLRMGRLAADHNDQLTEMDRVHGERITQIGTHAEQERTALNDEYNQRMLELGLHNANMIAAQKLWEEEAYKSAEAYWKKIKDLTEETPIGPPTQEEVETPYGGPNYQQRREKQAEAIEAKEKRDAAKPGTPEWNFWADKYIAADTWLKANGGYVGIPSSVNTRASASGTSLVAQASGAAYIMPQTAPAGVAGASVVVTVGDVNITGTTMQTAQDLAPMVQQIIYDSVSRAVGKT